MLFVRSKYSTATETVIANLSYFKFLLKNRTDFRDERIWQLRVAESSNVNYIENQ